jgi:hypothetical protein
VSESESGLPVTFAEGVRDDIAGLIAIAAADPKVADAEVEDLKRRIAGLLVECRDNPYLGEMMGPGRHAGLVDCRRTRFDIPSHVGKPRFRLIYLNYPADGPRPSVAGWPSGRAPD